MKAPVLPEVWLRGPTPGIPPLLQPVAHALLQAREEVEDLMKGFPEALLWERPAGVASPGFHLQHLAGVLDRLLTYARGGALSPQQLEALAAEVTENGQENEARTKSHGQAGLAKLLENFTRQVDLALRQLEETDESELTQTRMVGRAQIPSTMLGLLFHAAEHTQRHNGQLLVTVKVLKGAHKIRKLTQT